MQLQMNNHLQNAIAEMYPDYKNLILVDHSSSNSTWNAPLKTGKALEFLTLVSLIDHFKRLGANVCIPDIYMEKPYLFYLRNELPMHHAAQAGHSALLNDNISLKERFIAACTPKAQLSLNGESLYIMREGNPIHEFESAVKQNYFYKDRPDIGIFSGKVEVTEENKTIIAKSENINSSALYNLAVKNSNILPILDMQQHGEFNVTTKGIIECSVNKLNKAANAQISKYNEIFKNTPLTQIEFLFVNGGKDICSHDTLNVNMNELTQGFTSSSSSQVINSFLVKLLSLV